MDKIRADALDGRFGYLHPILIQSIPNDTWLGREIFEHSFLDLVDAPCTIDLTRLAISTGFRGAGFLRLIFRIFRTASTALFDWFFRRRRLWCALLDKPLLGSFIKPRHLDPIPPLIFLAIKV